MGWRIEYGLEEESGVPDTGLRRKMLTVCFFVVFCIMVSLCWPEGRELLRILLIPGDPEVTLEAAEAFARELHQGFPMGEAAKHFCIAVLTNEAAAGY